MTDFELAVGWCDLRAHDLYEREYRRLDSLIPFEQARFLALSTSYLTWSSRHGSASASGHRALRMARELEAPELIGHAGAVLSQVEGVRRPLWLLNDAHHVLARAPWGVGHAVAHAASIRRAWASNDGDSLDRHLAALTEHNDRSTRPYLARGLINRSNLHRRQGHHEQADVALERLEPVCAGMDGELGHWWRLYHALQLRSSQPERAAALLLTVPHGPGCSHRHNLRWSTAARTLGLHEAGYALLRAVEPTARGTSEHALLAAGLAVYHLAAGEVSAARELSADLHTRFASSMGLGEVIRPACTPLSPRDFKGLQNAAELWGTAPDLPLLLGAAMDRIGDPTDPTSLRIRRLLMAVHERAGRMEEATELLAAIPPETPAQPTPLGQFDALETIGAGANGRVLRALDTSTGLEVAVKLLLEPSAGSSLEAEFDAVAALNHPAIAPVLSMGRIDSVAAAVDASLSEGAPYVALELVRGGTLSPWCGRLRWNQVQPILCALLEGLTHAHGLGVLHLDLKPENVLVDRTVDGFRPRLADFGIGALFSSLPPEARRIGGSPAFMAPEQWSGRLEGLTTRTDLYGFGCLAWALITGEPPFGHDEDFRALAKRHRTTPRPPLPVGRGPEGLERWLHTLLAASPAERFHCALDALEALHAIDDVDAACEELHPIPLPSEAPTVLSETRFSGEFSVSVPLDLAERGTARQTVRLERTVYPRRGSASVDPTVAAAHFAVTNPLVWQQAETALRKHLAATAESGVARQVELVPDVRAGSGKTFVNGFFRRLREEGIPTHVIDLSKDDWSERLLESVLCRDGLRGRSPERMLAARFPGVTFEPGDEARTALQADLGFGPSVLFLVGGDAGFRELVSAQPCLIVSSTPCVDPSQRIRLPALSDEECARALDEQLWLFPTLRAELVRSASGNLDRALEQLGRLATRNELVREGRGWTLAPHALLAGPSDLYDVVTMLMREDGARRAVDWFSGASITAPAWIDSGVLMPTGRPTQAAGEAIEAWVREHASLDLWTELEEVAAAPGRLHALALAGLGRIEEAVDELLDEADRSFYSSTSTRSERLLDVVLEMSTRHRCSLPDRYFLARAWVDPKNTRSLERALRGSDTRAMALVLRASRGQSPCALEDLRESLSLEPDDEVSALATMNLTHELLRCGQLPEALEVLHASLGRLGYPHRIGCMRTWLAVSARSAPWSRWQAMLEEAIRGSEDSPMYAVDFLRGQAATALILRGRSQEASAWIDACEDPGLVLRARVMLAVEREDRAAVAELLASLDPDPTLARVVQLWLDAERAVELPSVVTTGSWARPMTVWLLERTRAALPAPLDGELGRWLLAAPRLDFSPFPGWTE